MPSNSLRWLSERFSYLKHNVFPWIFGRRTQDRDDDEFGAHTAHTVTLDVLDKPHPSFGPTPSPIDHEHLKTPRRFIYLKHKLFPRIFGRRTQNRDDEEFGTHTAQTLDVSDEPHSSFRPTPSPIDHEHPQLPRICKKKALLIGVEFKNGENRLESPHKDVRDMRQFLIGRSNRSKLESSKKYFERLSTISLADSCHYDPDDIITLINDLDDPEAVYPTKENIVWF